MKINVVWVEDVEVTKKSIWYNLEPELKDLDIEFNIVWFKNGSNVSRHIHERNRERGKFGAKESEDIIHLMLVDYNLDEELEKGQTEGRNGQMVIVDTRRHDHDLPILFYSANNDVELRDLIEDEHKVWFTHRDDFIDELIRLLKEEFKK